MFELHALVDHCHLLSGVQFLDLGPFNADVAYDVTVEVDLAANLTYEFARELVPVGKDDDVRLRLIIGSIEMAYRNRDERKDREQEDAADRNQHMGDVCS
jgi:hypothetical protein